MPTMKVICYRHPGPARDVLRSETIARPEPGPGAVLVRIALSGANPSDAKMRSGMRGPMAHPMIVPHSDGAGRIEAVGPGIDPARIGQRVWLWNAGWGRAMGTAAEFVALPSEQAVPLPDAASYADGACLGIPAQTAHRAVLADGPVAGRDVLVTGGAGAVGAYAVQMAKLGGARVIATASTCAKADHAHAMGADVTVDYRAPDAAEQILRATGGRGVDRIVEVEFGMNLPLSRAVLKDNGIIAAYGSARMPEPALPFSPLMFAGITLQMLLVYKLPPAARAAAIADLTGWLETGALRHPVALRVPLNDCSALHEAAECNARIGALLLEVAKGI